MLDVRRLRVLREVTRRGSLAAAAEALGYTTSAVSQQVAVLERETGTALVERRPRGVVPTEAGRLLAEHAEVVLAQLEAAEAALGDLRDLRRGHLRVSSFATAGATVLPRAVVAFRARHPDVGFSVAQASPAEGVAGLRAGRLDLALTADVPPAADVSVTHLFDDGFRVALHPDHPLAAAPRLRLADLAGETWIGVPSARPGGSALLRACRAAGFEPHVAHESDDYQVIRELVAAGAGLALVPELARITAREDVVERSLGPGGPSRAIQAATRLPPFRSAAAEVMLAVLLELGPWRPPAPPQVAGAAAAPSR